MTRLRDHALVFLFFLAFSAAWSWPVARLDPSWLITRQFDLYPSIWTVDVAPRALLGLFHSQSGWPEGESLDRADSFVLLGVGWLLGGRVSPAQVVSIFAWWGPALSAFAAERCAADGFLVRRPWSLMAGLVYGFSGVASVALLEGHPWYLLQPWLPVILWAWARGPSLENPWLGGIFAGIGWSLSLLTSAYFGIFALILLTVLLLSDLRRLPALLPGILGICLPVGLLYSWIFFQGGHFAQPTATGTEMLLRMGSTTLAGLSGWSNAADLSDHSLCAPVGWTGFALFLFAPVALRRESAWRALFGMSLLALVAMLGRTVRADLGSPLFDWPLDSLLGLPGLSFFRFPIRFGWLYALGAGVLSARVLGVLARALPRTALLPLLLLSGADAVLGIGLPWRLHPVPAQVPSAYDRAPADRAVLDLYGRPVHHSGELEMWAQNLSCYYQTHHHRPILDVCLGTMITSPRHRVDRWLTRAALQPVPPTEVVTRLGALGVGAVALHADWYRPNDLSSLQAGLQQLLGTPTADTADGGEHLILWTVPEVPSMDPLATWDSIRKEVF